MYSENIVMIVLIAGILIGIMFTVVLMSINKTHGIWTYGKLWYALDDRGNIVRAQFEHPTQGKKDIDNIIKLRGE